MAVIWALIFGATGVMLASALVLWTGPKRWVVWSDVAAKVYRHAGPPPWRVLNRVGRLATIAMYGSGCVLVCALAVGIWLEKTSPAPKGHRVNPATSTGR